MTDTYYIYQVPHLRRLFCSLNLTKLKVVKIDLSRKEKRKENGLRPENIQNCYSVA